MSKSKEFYQNAFAESTAALTDLLARYSVFTASFAASVMQAKSVPIDFLRNDETAKQQIKKAEALIADVRDDIKMINDNLAYMRDQDTALYYELATQRMAMEALVDVVESTNNKAELVVADFEYLVSSSPLQ